MKSFQVLLVVGVLGSGTVGAQEFCAPISCPAPVEVRCAPAPVREQYVLQEHTVMVPRQTVQRQRVASVSYQTIQRPRVETVYDQVPEYVPVQTQQTVMVPQTYMQPQSVTSMQAVYKDVPYQYQVQEFESQPAALAAESQPAAHDVTYRIKTQRVRRIIGPNNTVLREEPIGDPVIKCQTRTEYRNLPATESKLASLPVPKLRTATATQRVLEYQPVQQTYQVPVTVNVPRLQTTTQHVLQYRSVPRQVTTMESVQVPVSVDQEVEVPAIEYVPMRVQSYVPLSSLSAR